MKKLKFSLMPFIMALLLSVSCSEDGSTTSDSDSDSTTTTGKVEAPTLSLQVSESEVSSVELSASRASSEQVSVVTNQESTAISITVSEDAKDWCYCDLSAVSKILTITAYSENTTGDSRTATVTITAGTGSDAVTKTLTVVQVYDVASVTLELTSTLVQFYDYEDQMEEVYITTNQSNISISGLTSDSKFTASLSGKTITIKTNGANETDEPFTETIVVKVGDGDNTATKTITVTQQTSSAAVLYLSESSILFTSMDTEFTASIIVTTNKSNSTIGAEFSGDDAGKFSYSIEGNVVTVTGDKNLDGRDYFATLTITVGTGEYTASKSVSVYQEGAVEFVVSSTSATLAYSAGSTTTLAVTSNYPNDITASVVSGYEDYFTTSVGSVDAVAGTAVVTITALKDHITGSAASFDYSDAIKVAVLEGQGDLERNGYVTLTQNCYVLSVGSYYDEGVVYSVSTSQAMLLYKYEGGRLIWATSDTTMIEGALDTDDGESNTAAIKAYGETLEGGFATNFPACYWCTSLGDGWYMPAENEVVAFLTYLTVSSFTSALTAAGADAMTSGEFYWASNGDTSTAGSARAIRNSSGTWSKSSYGKTNTSGRYTRAVKKVTLMK